MSRVICAFDKDNSNEIVKGGLGYHILDQWAEKYSDYNVVCLEGDIPGDYKEGHYFVDEYVEDDVTKYRLKRKTQAAIDALPSLVTMSPELTALLALNIMPETGTIKIILEFLQDRFGG